MTYQKIQDLLAEDRPREILFTKGREILRLEEILAILIGTGIRDYSALDLAREMIRQVDGDLATLGRWGLPEYRKIKGIGVAKAAVLVAAMELGRRRMDYQASATVDRIRQSADAYDLLKSHLADLVHEEFWVIYLNRAARMIKKECISRGGIAGTVVDIKLILKSAIHLQASSLILAHNHPSGHLQPSEADKQLTNRMLAAAKSVDMLVADHLIISASTYVSFADEGWM
ncbi:MAG: DNA repair protein RadC [Cytophagaceae bacterium]|nr:DNA repair protein RadC [Cytophagaceae bacterium]MBP6093936.1 DNA repair protein RadC [Cytophagaceae bacterium]